jgi:hypothetical protein
MELICDGVYDYKKSMLFNNSIQNASVSFSMKNIENDVLKISKSKVEIVSPNCECCNDNYILQYSWTKRDVNESGTYKGWFEIKFNGDLYEEGVNYHSGNLIIPIENELIIHIQ